MKKILLILIVTLLSLSLVGCSSPNINQNGGESSHPPNEEITPPSEDLPTPEPEVTPPETTTPPNSKPPTEPEQNKPSETVKPTPIIPIKDKLIHIKADYLNLYSDKNQTKWVGIVRKNDRLNLIKEEKYYYVSKFNHSTIYVKKNSSVEIKEQEKGSLQVENVIKIAKDLIGTKYVYGAERYHFNGVKNNKFDKRYYDCSSFVQYSYYIGAGIKLDVTSRGQSRQGKTITKSNLRRGDLMFFTTKSRKHLSGLERIGHVAIYLGDNYILHTAYDYAIIEPISATRWSNYIHAKRVIN